MCTNFCKLSFFVYILLGDVFIHIQHQIFRIPPQKQLDTNKLLFARSIKKREAPISMSFIMVAFLIEVTSETFFVHIAQILNSRKVSLFVFGFEFQKTVFRPFQPYSLCCREYFKCFSCLISGLFCDKKTTHPHFGTLFTMTARKNFFSYISPRNS